MYKQPDILPIMFDVIEKNYYIVWWIISDNYKGLTRMCQKMAAMLCGCSALKGHALKLKQASHRSKCCVRCDLSMVENPKHIVMQCPFYDQYKHDMYHDITQLGNHDIDELLVTTNDVFSILMGKHPINVSMEHMLKLWVRSGKYICMMYDSAVISI